MLSLSHIQQHFSSVPATCHNLFDSGEWIARTDRGMKSTCGYKLSSLPDRRPHQEAKLTSFSKSFAKQSA